MKVFNKIDPTFKAAGIHTIPVMLGYIFMGMAFGILLVSKGYSFIWAFVMSVVMFAGTGQFVAINLLAPGITLLEVFIMQLMINARHAFYGLSLIDKFKNMGWKKLYMIFALTDENYALITSSKPPGQGEAQNFYFFIALLDHCYWILGCTLGGLIGTLITFNTQGIDFVMVALFTVLAVELWLESKSHLPALMGFGGSFLCLLIFGPDSFLIPALCLILLALTLSRKPIETKEKEDVPC